MAISYKDAGVDWELGEAFVKGISALVKRTYNPNVRSGVGGYASLFSIGDGRYLAAGTDGVGTKLKVAQSLGIHDTIGIDLVAMCANDVICVGAKPLFFLDYIVCEKLDIEVSTAIVKGISDGCLETGMALVGGETAEHPGAFPKNEYDLAGFCVGEVHEREIIDGSKVKPGDAIVALPSSGLHSNGFSLVRKLISEEEKELLKTCLNPTKLYVKVIRAAMEKFTLKGLAHVTGSAFNKIPRISKSVGYSFHELPPPPAIFGELSRRSGLAAQELYSTFNMGTGMVVVTDKGVELVDFFRSQGEKAVLAGEVTDEAGVVRVESGNLKFVLQP
jgi:phosphoribosylformylglycinamidine cyclo-ligase